MSGSCENVTLTFGGSGFPVDSEFGYNMFVLRYRPDGTAGFAEFAKDVIFSDPMVLATADGHAYLAGSLQLPNVQWGNIQFNGPDWVNAAFLTRLDSTGQFLWGVQHEGLGGTVTGDLAPARDTWLALDAEDRPVLMGSLRGTVDWGNGVFSGGQGIDQRSVTVVAFAADGNAQWAATSQPGDPHVTARSVTAGTAPGVVHFMGHAAGEITFGAHTVGSELVHTAVVGRISGVGTGVVDLPGGPILRAWPNPVAEVLYMEVDATTALPAVLWSSAGQRLRDISLQPGRNTLNAGGLAPGLYLLRTVDGGAVRVVKE